MTTHTAPPAPDLADLAAALADLARLGDVDRALAARRLAASLPAQLAAIADAAVYAATRGATYATVAGRLGVSVKAVEKAVRQHRARTGA